MHRGNLRRWVTAAIVGLTLSLAGTSCLSCKENEEPGRSPIPTWETGTLEAKDIGASRVTIEWQGAQDDVEVTEYRVTWNSSERRVDGTITALELDGFRPGQELEIDVQAGDADGNWSTDGPSLRVILALPDDPSEVAPANDLTVATSLGESTSFLTQGADPIQIGVASGTLDDTRVAVLRGRVVDETGQPHGGVRVSIVDHPEFGETFTRSDGWFDLAVNGGTALVVRYEQSGSPSVERTIEAPWQDFVTIDDVTLRHYDSAATEITMGAPTMQVARASVSSDETGTRRATVLFPPGTTAQLRMPEGSLVPAPKLTVRASEYTVGPSGPAAMPGPLPPSSAYTYAVELSADEAIAAGATGVEFDQPVIVYVENFVGMPDGGGVPVGYYDHKRGVWVAAPTGRVVSILEIADGVARLDIDGDGMADEGPALEALGVTDAERQELASLYPPNTSLWRVAITHFSPWDCNWPFTLPEDALAGLLELLDLFGHIFLPNCMETGGSEIGCERRSLSERIGVVGTPFSLHYESDRVPGRGDLYELDIPLTGAMAPQSLVAVNVQVEVAGQRMTARYAAAPNLTHHVSWNGRDVYGRVVQGRQPVSVRVGYEYQPQYTPVAADWSASFGRAPFEGPPGVGPSVLARVGANIVLWRDWKGALGAWNAAETGLGGWSLSAHHVYDPNGRVLYRGDGSERSAAALGRIIESVAGYLTDGPNLVFEENVDARRVSLGPKSLAVGSDGTLYIADHFTTSIRKVTRDGLITTVAGGPKGARDGEGIPALDEDFTVVSGLAVAGDGSIYVSDASRAKIRVIRSGRSYTFAGTGKAGSPTNGARATETPIVPLALALGPDGSLYVATWKDNRVYRIGTDGVINAVAGTGSSGFSGDGGAATKAKLSHPSGLAVDRFGNLYIADTLNGRIRKVAPDGTIDTVAGRGAPLFWSDGDGGRAVDAALFHPSAVALAWDGSLLIVERDARKIRRVGPDGIITTIAGPREALRAPQDPSNASEGDGGLATAAKFRDPTEIATLPDGTIFVSDYSRVRRIQIGLSGSGKGETLIASADGIEIYQFDARGKHLATLDALTRVPLLTFDYDSTGRLERITDVSGNVTTIERDAKGMPTGIVGPYGHRTTLNVSDGYLQQVTNPAGDTASMTYHRGGLIASFTDARGGRSTYTFDREGRLVRDDARDGTRFELSETSKGLVRTVTMLTSGTRATVYRTEVDRATGERQRTVTQPSGARMVHTERADGHQVVHPDGTTVVVRTTPDPRYMGQIRLPAEVALRTPGGRGVTTITTRSTRLADPNNALSVTQQVDTTTTGSRRSTVTYDATARTITEVTPSGRARVTGLDERGRVVEVTSPGLHPVRTSYDARGRVHKVTQGDRVTTFSYDDRGNVATVIDPIGRVTSYEHDGVGRVVAYHMGGETVRHTFDAHGNVLTIRPPGRGEHIFEYTPGDLPSRYTAPVIGENTAVEQYDYASRAFDRTRVPSGDAVDYETNPENGRLVSVATSTEKLTYEIDTAGRTTAIASSDGSSLEYEYDGALLLGTTWSGDVSGTVRLSYGPDLSVAMIRVNEEAPISYERNADAQLTRAGPIRIEREAATGFPTHSSLGVTTESWTFNGYGEVETYEAKAHDALVLSLAYERDHLGRLTKRTETNDGKTTTWNYTYDPLGRLDTTVRDGSVVADYDHDGNGNRTVARIGGRTVTASYDARDRLTQYGDIIYVHDADGDRTTRTEAGATTTYVHEARGRLVSVTLPSGKMVSYRYDPMGRRVERQFDGSTERFLYLDGIAPIAEVDGENRMVSLFVYGLRRNVPEAMVKAGVTYKLISDHLGSVRLVVNASSGEIAQRIDYDEFGRVIQDTNPGFQPFGFAGGILDRATGLIRFGARDYDPEVGRFVTADPVGFAGGDLNLYGYAGGDPINYIDPTGLNFERCLEDIFNLAGMIPGIGVPFDVAAGLLALARGDGLSALSSFASAYPGVGDQFRAAQYIRQGGRFRDLLPLSGYERHHMPSANALSTIAWRYKDGPSIRMLKRDHQLTASYGRGDYATAWHQKEVRYIQEGRMDLAIAMNIDDVRSLFGSKYDKAIREMIDSLSDDLQSALAHLYR